MEQFLLELHFEEPRVCYPVDIFFAICCCQSCITLSISPATDQTNSVYALQPFL
jgi:hypothetical protein